MIDGVPSNNGYKPGFSAEMMRKDLRLSQDAALSVNATTQLAAHALSIFSHFCDSGDSQTDYSGISKLIGGNAWEYRSTQARSSVKQIRRLFDPGQAHYRTLPKLAHVCSSLAPSAYL